MKSLFVYLKDYKKECVLGPLFKLLEAGFDLIVPMVMAVLIDQGIPRGDTAFIWKIGGILLLLALIGLTCSITAQYFAAKAAVGFATELRHAVFAHIEELSFTELDQVGTSTLLTRMTSDINQLQSGVNMALRLFLRSPFIVFGAAILAFTYDVKAAMIFVVVIPALALVIFGIMLITMPLYKKVQEHLDRLLGLTRQNLNGVRVIRAFNMQEDEEQTFAGENDALTKMQFFVGRISALMNPVTYIMINIALVVLIWTGALRINAGTLTQGQLVALINYMSQILIELVKLANTIILTTKSVACGKRIENLLSMKNSLNRTEGGLGEEATAVSGSSLIRAEAGAGEAELTSEKSGNIETKKRGADRAALDPVGARRDKNKLPLAPAKVEFDHVSLTYQGAGYPSLEDISFTAQSGQTIGIIGGTGSGKTSLVHLIPRFYDASKGCVRINGQDVRSLDIDSLRDSVGIVMQKTMLFHGTIRENIRWGNPEADDEQIMEAIRLAQFEEVLQSKKDGLDTEIEQGGRNLSGGQRQRLSIARALVRRPSILILDDSSSALDFATDAKLRKALAQIKSYSTTFIVSQRTSSIRHADQILVLDDGELIGIGTHEELLTNCDVYREIHEIGTR